MATMALLARCYRLLVFLVVVRASSCLVTRNSNNKPSLHRIEHRKSAATPSLSRQNRASRVSLPTSDAAADANQDGTSNNQHRYGGILLEGKQKVQALARWCNANFFVVGMVVAVTAARVAPTLASCNGGLPERLISQYGVTLIFLLSGLSLQLQQLSQAIGNVKLNACLQGTTFVVWPLVVSGLVQVYTWLCTVLNLNLLPRALLDGFIIVSCLPTTVNMCVILTQAAGGNVAAALTNAVLSNLAGIVVTPALLYHHYSGQSVAAAHTMLLHTVPFGDMMRKLSQKVLLPVVVGQLLRLTPLLNIYQTHTAVWKRAQEVILLSILWSAFCQAIVSPLGLQLSWTGWMAFGVLVPLLHVTALAASFVVFSTLGFSRDNVVAAMFGASHKTLAFGVPLIQTMFRGHAQLASYCAPILLLHPVQLVVGSLLVPRLQRYTSRRNETMT